MAALRAEDDKKASRSILSLIGKMFDFTSQIDFNACTIMFSMINKLMVLIDFNGFDGNRINCDQYFG